MPKRPSKTASTTAKKKAPADKSPAVATPPKTDVKITAAKGRPMLNWVGKRPLGHLRPFPAQQIERFSAGQNPPSADWSGWPSSYPQGGLLLHGDNKEVLTHLIANGFRSKVQLVYIDPPFDSGADYVRKVSLRGPKGTTKIDGETYSLGEQIQYTDIWANDNYLQFMYERLLLLKELLAEDASIYLHCDARRSHMLRLLMDEVFSADGFVSEIIWQSSDAQSSARRYGPIHNTIFYYARGSKRTWNESVRTPLSKSTADTWYTHEEITDKDIVNSRGQVVHKGTTRRFNAADLSARKKGGDTEYEWKGVRPPVGRYWAYSKENMTEFESKGLIYYTGSGRPYLKRFLDEVEGIAPQDLWTDISMIRGISDDEDTGYPTEKPEPILERILKISSQPGDLVLDCFIGSGTTAAVAQKLGRRWIGCDINKGAIQTTAKRLQGVIKEQAAELKQTKQQALLGDDDTAPTPAQLGFTTWRVNDYDLQVQHNEAQELACTYLGVTRTKTDGFFHGTLGKALVRIVPFEHPLSPEDLELVREELEARKDEDRAIKMVCLGVEIAAQAWLDEWNRLRKGKATANRIDVIELRDDPAHGGWLNHTPAEAKVSIARKKDRIVVSVDNFISPTIVERLKQQSGVLTPKIDDFRAMIDSVAIDTAYDGRVFNVVEVDVPEKKTDFVTGRYELAAPSGETTVAVRITDMLGEDVLVTKRV